MTDLGKVSITPKGNFLTGTSYEKLDLVLYEESSYLSLLNNNTFNVTDSSKWQLIAAKGNDGLDGLKGDKGDKGDTGYKTIDPYPINPDDAAPIIVGWYKPEEIGTYSNIGLEALTGYDTFFYFNGTEWIRSQIPVSTLISDGSVTTSKTNFANTDVTVSKNIADPSKEYTGNYINWDTGDLAVNPAYNAFFKLPVTGDTDYFFTKLYHLAWYDVGGNFISGENIGGASISKHSPVLAKYVSVSFSVADTNIQIELGTVGTAYVPYSIIEKVDIPNLVVKPNQTSFAEERLVFGKNRFDKTQTTSGQFVNAFTGAYNANPIYQASDYCNVEDLEKITLTSLIHIAFYDDTKTYISGREYGGDTIDVPTNAVWCRVSLFDNGMEQTFQIEEGEVKTSYEAYQEPAKIVVIPDLYLPSISPEVTRPVIITPSVMYWMSGKQMNVYYDSSVYGPIADSVIYYNSVFSYRGRFLENKYRVTPIDDFNFVLKIEDSKGTTIQKNTDVLTALPSNGSGQNRKILVIGDSTVNAGVTIKEIFDFFNTDLMDVTFQGTRTTLGVKHEGRGGWTFQDYCTEGRSLYKFNYSSASVSKDDVYSNNGSNYQVVEINSGYFSAQRILGSSLPTSTGVLTKVSGTGDTSINYTSYEILDGNPFWNYTTLNFDFSMYLSNTSQTMGSNDWVFIQLGINDLFGAALVDNSFNVNARVSQMKAQLATMIANIHSYNPNIKIGILQTIPPAISQDATGNLNNSAFYSIEYYVKKGLVKWWGELLSVYDNVDSRNSKIYLLGTAPTIDRVNNFPKVTESIDSHNNTQIEVYNNDVHPSDAGYKQMADVYIGAIKYFG